MFLHLELRFIAGSYGGSEWPPAPMRLFQALVAGIRNGTHPALAWLESLPPPTILAELAPAEVSVRTFVPNNTAKGPAATPEQKAVRERILRRVEAPVRYVWPIAATDKADAEALIEVTQKLHTLGTGHDMASAHGWLTEDFAQAGTATQSLWQSCMLPAGITAGGVALRVPLCGSLASVEARFQAGLHRYSADAGFIPPVLPPAAHRVLEFVPSHLYPRHLAIPVQLLPFGGTALPRWPLTNCVPVGAMLRHAAMTALENSPFHDWASGYAPADDLDARLSWVPLPSIGHDHADRGIRRALFLARTDAAQALATLHQSLLSGDIQLRDAGSGNIQAIARPLEPDHVLATYMRPGHVWQTVTPIALPGDFATDERRTRRLLLKALAEAGIDVALVSDITTSRTPMQRHDPPLSAMRLKAWRAHATPLVYARITFSAALRGPLVIGRGRHYGLGLMCANPE